MEKMDKPEASMLVSKTLSAGKDKPLRYYIKYLYYSKDRKVPPLFSDILILEFLEQV